MIFFLLSYVTNIKRMSVSYIQVQVNNMIWVYSDQNKKEGERERLKKKRIREGVCVRARVR